MEFLSFMRFIYFCEKYSYISTRVTVILSEYNFVEFNHVVTYQSKVQSKPGRNYSRSGKVIELEAVKQEHMGGYKYVVDSKLLFGS